MSVFIILIYARAWFEVPLAADAPFNDLTLFHDLHKYRDLNSQISEATVKTFKRHFWYLGTDLVDLSLFSDKVMIEEKTKMVEKLAIDKELDKKWWTTVTQDASSVNLSDLVTKESLFSFTQLNPISCAQLEGKRGIQPEQRDRPTFGSHQRSCGTGDQTYHWLFLDPHQGREGSTISPASCRAPPTD